MPERRAYPSDLSDARWQLIAPLLIEETRRGRRRSTDLREVVNAINYRWSTGCTWRMLPHDFPPWETVYTYFDRWRRSGRLREIREVILRKSPYVPLRDWPSCHPDQPRSRGNSENRAHTDLGFSSPDGLVGIQRSQSRFGVAARRSGSCSSKGEKGLATSPSSVNER